MPTHESASDGLGAQLEAMIGKFDPQARGLIREVRSALRRRLPTANELVYDNYNFFVIGYCSTERPSDCIVSIAAAANGVNLSFYRGADVPDPDRILQGSGSQNRFIRLEGAATLARPGSRLPRAGIPHRFVLWTAGRRPYLARPADAQVPRINESKS